MSEEMEYARSLVIWTLAFYIGIDSDDVCDEQYQSLEQLADSVWDDPNIDPADQRRMLGYALSLAAEVIEMLAAHSGEDPAVTLDKLTHEDGTPIQRDPGSG